METHRTTTCGSFGHREFTIQLTRPSPIPNIHLMLTNFFERAVERGTKFLPGQTVQLGWAMLRLRERSDGTLGVEERELSPTPAWTESVDRALHDLWNQKEIGASVGLERELSFPKQDEDVLVSNCGMDARATLFMRLSVEDAPRGFSGWTLTCADDHDHGERRALPLLAIAANSPGLVQLLALPHGTSVLVVYESKPGVPDGMQRIAPHIFRNGGEIKPQPGSYLAALQA